MPNMAKHSSSPRGRIGAPKSRSGCKTCKIRRVKCGEEKPKCLRCTSTGRKCDFEIDEVSPPLTPHFPSYALSSSPNSGKRERRAFEYYFQNAAQYLSGGMDIDFWTGVVPQICRTEPAVWDAIIAISALFEYPEQSSHFTFLGNGDQTNALKLSQKEALTWYSRSISSIHSQIERGSADPYIALVSCVLFICVETIQGRMEEALKLLQQGFTLIRDLRSRAFWGTVSVTKSALLENTLLPLFLRLNTIALSISGTPASELFSFSNTSDYVFTSLSSARQVISTLAAESMIFEREAGLHLRTVGDTGISQEFLIRQQDLKLRLASWRDAYTELCRNPQHKLISGPYAEPILLAYHAAASIFVAGCLTRHQTVYDAHIEGFQTIIEQSSLVLDASTRPNGAQPPFTFEMGVGIPLYLTALKCRHPTLRRKALHLLRQGPPVQGFYKCLPGFALAGHLMALEEDYSAQLARSVTQNDIPEPHVIVGINNGAAEPLTLSAIIPEEARICDAGVFRPQNGIPNDVSEADVAKWKCDPEQLFISFRRLRRSLDAWVIIHDCAPTNF